MTEIRKVGNFDNQGGQRVVEDVMVDLKKSIAYFIAEENRDHLREWDLEEFAAAIYLLAIMAELLDFSCGIKPSTVRRWQDIYLPLYDERYPEVDTPDLLRANIVEAFDHLEAVARLRPPFDWHRKEQD